LASVSESNQAFNECGWMSRSVEYVCSSSDRLLGYVVV